MGWEDAIVKTGVVQAPVCNPSYSGGIVRKILVWDPYGQNSDEK
jgi:hypothetical protein